MYAADSLHRLDGIQSLVSARPTTSWCSQWLASTTAVIRIILSLDKEADRINPSYIHKVVVY
jgi:hypothetical protein